MPELDLPLDPWRPRTLGSLLERAATLWPNQDALVIDDERVTFRGLTEHAQRIAVALRDAGVREGDHVAICMGNSVAWVATFYATGILGAVCVPINTRLKTDEVRYCLVQADISTLVLVDRFLDKLDFVAMLRAIEPAIDSALPGMVLPSLRSVLVLGADVPRGCVRLTLIGQDDDERVSDAAHPDDALLIQFTSGTTAFPKGVILTHDNMLRNAAYVARRIGVRPGDRYFSARPFFHVAGTTLSLLVALSSGACLVSQPVFDAQAALATLEHERCTLISGNDTIFQMLINHPSFDPSRLHLRGGWAAAGPVVMRQAMECMGAPELCWAYGLSEASPNVVMSDWSDDRELRIAGRARPHDGVEVRCVDPHTGEEQPPEVAGEILVRGWSVMRGYYRNPDATARAIDSDGWLHTGDLGELDAHGRLRFVGRLKDILRVGGENVAPAEIEEVLHAHTAVYKAEVIGVPDARLGEVVAAYVQLREGSRIEPAELIAWCGERCAGFKTPRYLRVVEDFESIGMTGSAKVRKDVLRARALDDFGLGN